MAAQGDAIARWVRRHPEGDRLRAAFDASDAAIEEVVTRVRAENPSATPADVRASIRLARRELELMHLKKMAEKLGSPAVATLREAGFEV